MLGPAAGSPSSYTAETTVSPILASLSPSSEVYPIPPIHGSLAALPNSKSPSPIPQPAAFPPGGFLAFRERVPPFRSLLSLPSVPPTVSPFRMTLLPPLLRAGSGHAAPPILRSCLTFRKILCPLSFRGLLILLTTESSITESQRHPAPIPTRTPCPLPISGPFPNTVAGSSDSHPGVPAVPLQESSTPYPNHGVLH